MDFVLLGGLWLTPDVWDDVVTELDALGHRGIPVLLPGQGDGNTSATLEDQIAAALTVVRGLDRPVVVGHSAAATLAWLVADRAPDAASRLVFVGGFPSDEEAKYADFFPIVDGAMPFPGWRPFNGPDSDDLTDEQKSRVAAAAVPVPAGVVTTWVEYTNEARKGVPVTMICPEFAPEDAESWIENGDVPELLDVEVEYVDIPTGHWPMVSAPKVLAEALAGVV